jgi:hypothetical protein
MTFSKLIAYNCKLNTFSADTTKKIAVQHLDLVIQHLESDSVVKQDDVETFKQQYANILAAFDSLETTLNSIKIKINEQILLDEKYWLNHSLRRYKKYVAELSDSGFFGTDVTYKLENGIAKKGVDQLKVDTRQNIITQSRLLDGPDYISDHAKNLIASRLKLFSHYQYPAMILRPGTLDLNNLVANDPLYLIDEHLDLITPCMNQFNEVYKKRLRPYVVNDMAFDSQFELLPNNQFALCVAYNYFDRKPMEIIKIYLEVMYKKLRPGGVLAMTFSNCDQANAVVAVENNVAFYTPGRILDAIADEIGYNQTFKFCDDENPITWLELTKPGSLTSIRGGQAMAKIIHK